MKIDCGSLDRCCGVISCFSRSGSAVKTPHSPHHCLSRLSREFQHPKGHFLVPPDDDDVALGWKTLISPVKDVSALSSHTLQRKRV